jgi:DNA-binding response OmpR family regulator
MNSIGEGIFTPRKRHEMPAALRRQNANLQKGMTGMDHSFMKTTILLLVSDPPVRSVLEKTLEHEGYTVLTAGDLGQAIDRMKECPPDLLITRNYVEGLPGQNAAMYLRAKRPGMRVLMLGGLPDDQGLRYRESLEGFEVFPKPYAPAELLKKVKDVLSAARGWQKESCDRLV